jgi:hypothetical protein
MTASSKILSDLSLISHYFFRCYGSDFQPVFRSILVSLEGSGGVQGEFGGRSKRSKKNLRNKKFMIDLIFLKITQ